MFKGKRVSYVSGRCGDGNKKLNYKGTFDFDDGTNASDSHVQACTRG